MKNEIGPGQQKNWTRSAEKNGPGQRKLGKNGPGQRKFSAASAASGATRQLSSTACKFCANLFASKSWSNLNENLQTASFFAEVVRKNRRFSKKWSEILKKIIFRPLFPH